jgi:hypothetical protein
MKNTLFKLTDQNLRTYNQFQWALGKWAPAIQGNELCAPGVYHAYTDPSLALLLNPIHASILSPRLWVAEYRGPLIDTDNGLKVGVNKLRLVREIKFTPPTTDQHITFALLCALEECRDRPFTTFANNWLRGKDRSFAAADAMCARLYFKVNALSDRALSAIQAR